MPVTIPEFVSVATLASLLRVKINTFTSKLRQLGFENTSHDHVFSAETAGLIAAEYRVEPVYEKTTMEGNDLHALPEVEDKSMLPSRPPIVTIMGHVDHGKTTLLDYLRKSSVAASEYGGITQHIGAFSVRMPSGKLITFLDTPGHEAFLTMRRRGAHVTDIVILVVAADDSVKPQTIEAIRHAKSARVPIIVAINKVDRPEANPEKVKQDLATNGVEVEDIGGDTQAICVSGKTGQGMDELEDATVTLSEVLDIRADPEGRCEGWILEAATKKAGRVATVLVRRGTLRPGQVVVADSTWARVKTLKNEAGIEIDSAGPGTPVEVDGWKDQPSAGADVLQCDDEEKAKSVVEFRSGQAERMKIASDVEAVNELRRWQHAKREEEEAKGRMRIRVTADDESLSSTGADKTPSVIEVPFVIKGDVGGSVEAVENSIMTMGNDRVRPKILRVGVGVVTEFDVELAGAAKGSIIAFNTKADANIVRLAEMEGVPILEHNIIYHLTDDVRQRLAGKLPALVVQRVTGEAEIAEVFTYQMKRSQSKAVAGCKVRNGIISRTSKIRVIHDQDTIFDGRCLSVHPSIQPFILFLLGLYLTLHLTPIPFSPFFLIHSSPLPIFLFPLSLLLLLLLSFSCLLPFSPSFRHSSSFFLFLFLSNFRL